MSLGPGAAPGAQQLGATAPGSPRERLAAWEAQQRQWARHEEMLVAEERRCVAEADYAGAGAVRAEIRRLRGLQLEEVEKAVRERYRQLQASLIAEMARRRSPQTSRNPPGPLRRTELRSDNPRAGKQAC